MREYYDSIAESRLRWRKRNRYYNMLLEKYFKFIIPAGSNVLELGCGTGDLLNAVHPAKGVGIDYSEKMVKVASDNFKDLTFYVQDAEDINLKETFDYIILSDLLSSVQDVQKVFKCIRAVSDENTRIIISNYSYLWEPVLKFGEGIGLKQKQPLMNWLSAKDIENILSLEGFELIKSERKILFPKKIPLISAFLNSFIINLPIVKNLSLINLIVVRKREEKKEEHSVTIVVPARNEKGNIENAIIRTPSFGTFQEFIFIEGNSIDGTYEEILRVQEKYRNKKIVAMKQNGKGKGNAVREAFAAATGEVLMILDADLTMPPEDLQKYYEALVSNKGEFINGCRLVYPMEGQAMRFLNLLANKFFGVLFTYLLGQNLKDTLCGTKVLYKKDYTNIINNRKYFGDFDPFGDFDLLFGASKLNLKIVEMPIRYKDRLYGETQIKRFSHGWLLIKMSLFAAKKMKFI